MTIKAYKDSSFLFIIFPQLSSSNSHEAAKYGKYRLYNILIIPYVINLMI